VLLAVFRPIGDEGMNLLVLSLNYSPEPTGFAPHITALCEHMARQGHKVTVVTGFPFAPTWSRWPEYRGKIAERKRINGVEVIRVSHFIPRRPRQLYQRLLMEGSFSLMAATALLSRLRSRLDMILYVGAQPAVAMLARILSILLGTPYAVAINDLAARAAVDVGIVRREWLSKALESFEYGGYHGASGAIVLCAAFREALVARDYPRERIRLIRSPVDLKLIRPLQDAEGVREQLGLSDGDFVILYSGSMGLKQDLSNVIVAAFRLKKDSPSVKWVLVGEGELKPRLLNLIKEYDLRDCVQLLPLQPETQIAAMFSSADVLLLSQLATVKDTAIPSKLMAYMAAGKAVLAAVDPSSQAAELLRESGGGVVVAPQDPSALVAAVKNLIAQTHLLRTMGRSNRKYAEQHLDQRQIVAAQEAFLMDIVRWAGEESARA